MSDLPNFICRVNRYIYGYSGNEIPPRVETTETFMYHSQPNEDRETFAKRMSELVLPYREAANAQPRRYYSERDGWSWEIIDITPKPIEVDYAINQ